MKKFANVIISFISWKIQYPFIPMEGYEKDSIFNQAIKFVIFYCKFVQASKFYMKNSGFFFLGFRIIKIDRRPTNCVQGFWALADESCVVLHSSRGDRGDQQHSYMYLNDADNERIGKIWLQFILFISDQVNCQLPIHYFYYFFKY